MVEDLSTKQKLSLLSPNITHFPSNMRRYGNIVEHYSLENKVSHVTFGVIEFLLYCCSWLLLDADWYLCFLFFAGATSWSWMKKIEFLLWIVFKNRKKTRQRWGSMANLKAKYKNSLGEEKASPLPYFHKAWLFSLIFKTIRLVEFFLVEKIVKENFEWKNFMRKNKDLHNLFQ